MLWKIFKNFICLVKYLQHYWAIADNFMYNYIIIISLKFTQIVDSMVYEQK